MTSSELKVFLKDVNFEHDESVKVLFAHIGIGIVDALEQIREEMITRMPLTEERNTMTNYATAGGDDV